MPLGGGEVVRRAGDAASWGGGWLVDGQGMPLAGGGQAAGGWLVGVLEVRA